MKNQTLKNELRILKQKDNVYENIFKPISYRRSHRLSKRSLSAVYTDTFNDLQKAAKHVQWFSRVEVK
jgi:hypothetical protein